MTAAPMFFSFSQVCTISSSPVWNLSLLTSTLKKQFYRNNFTLQCMYLIAVEGDHLISDRSQTVDFGTYPSS